MLLAKEYGQSPADVENWPVYWFDRAVEYMHGQGIENEREAKERQKKMTRR